MPSVVNVSDDAGIHLVAHVKGPPQIGEKIA
jgi:hypothetical protein